MLADMLEDLAEELKAHSSQDVTVRRTGQTAFTLDATLTTLRLRTTDAMGNVKIERPDMTAIFTAADYNFGSGVVQPAAGDTFDAVLGSTTKRFRIMPKNAAGEPSWHYLGGQQTLIRAFLKYVSNP